MRPTRWLTALTLASAIAALLCAATASADYSLRQKQFIKQQDEYLAHEVKQSDEKCKMKLGASIDWNSFKDEMDKQLDGKLSRSFYGYCGLVPNNLFSMCQEETACAAIRQKIKVYVCKFGGKGKRAIRLDGARLTFWVDWEAPNNDAFIKGYLGKQL